MLCLVREREQGKLVGIFNFNDYGKIAWIDETDGMYQDMMTGEILRASRCKGGRSWIQMVKKSRGRELIGRRLPALHFRCLLMRCFLVLLQV